MLRRLVILATLLLAALNTRTVIAALAPIVDFTTEDLNLSVGDLILLGMLPPLCYTIFALAAPSLVRRSGLEWSMAIALAAMTTGHVIRTLADTPGLFATGTVTVLAGIGVGNVLMPPLVRRYFSRHVGTVTALYVCAHVVGTSAPAWVGVPVSMTVGWRAALGIWALCALLGLVVWMLVLRPDPRRDAERLVPVPPSRASPRRGGGRQYRSLTAWAAAALFSIAAGHAYAAMAWLPQMMVDLAGASTARAGGTLALYSAAGVIPGIAAPLLAVRIRRVDVLVHVFTGLLIAGYLGLLLSPAAAPELWALLTGAGGSYFALCLVLINLRTRTAHATVAVSAFVQGVGYVMGAVGPLLVGLIHLHTGSWRVAIAVLLATTVVAFAAGLILRRERFVEDEWEPHSAG